MAQNIRLLWNLSRGTINNMLFRNTTSTVVNAHYMFTDAVLKLPEYEKARQSIRAQYMVVEDVFRAKMKTVCETADAAVYLEDLKAMAHIVQKTNADLELLAAMIKKYCTGNNQQFSSFNFGPVLMRAYYFLDEPQEAYNMVMSPEGSRFFSKYNTMIVLMTLLYKHGMYKEVIDIWNKGEELNSSQPYLNDRRRVLLYASLAKQNTPEALELAEEVWHGLLRTAKRPVKREINLYLYILLQHSKLSEILSLLEDQRLSTRLTNYYHIVCYLGLGEYEKALGVMKQLVDERRIGCLWNDLNDRINNIPPSEVKDDMLDMYTKLRECNAFLSQPLENYIFNPISEAELASNKLRRQKIIRNRSAERLRRTLI